MPIPFFIYSLMASPQIPIPSRANPSTTQFSLESLLIALRRTSSLSMLLTVQPSINSASLEIEFTSIQALHVGVNDGFLAGVACECY